jgi:hypothetical protein
MNRLATIGFRIFGTPPARDAATVERLRWIRRFYIRPLPLYALIFLVAVFSGVSKMVWVALGLSAVIWIQGITSLGFRIRRVRDDPARGSGGAA